MSQKLPGPFARAFRVVDVWALSCLLQIGLVEDEDLNVVMLDGQANMTVSDHTSAAAMTTYRRSAQK
jgi:hypothetical protein